MAKPEHSEPLTQAFKLLLHPEEENQVMSESKDKEMIRINYKVVETLTYTGTTEIPKSIYAE